LSSLHVVLLEIPFYDGRDNIAKVFPKAENPYMSKTETQGYPSTGSR
jgi:hypothetical protein